MPKRRHSNHNCSSSFCILSYYKNIFPQSSFIIVKELSSSCNWSYSNASQWEPWLLSSATYLSSWRIWLIPYSCISYLSNFYSFSMNVARCQGPKNTFHTCQLLNKIFNYLLFIPIEIKFNKLPRRENFSFYTDLHQHCNVQ